uniref:Uncharacterized protein n=1 Tax=viral metagenome TaxID=1070528 RepID=A0A6C0AW15_9ZZZZ|tara:strand:+ start:14628 stop:16400 length:1773 start_codon:yes stop_codon:yes gene_type:complete
MVKTLKRKKQLKIRNTKRSKLGGVDEKLLSAAELAARPPLNKISVSENMDKEKAKLIRYKAKHKILGHIPKLASQNFGKTDLVKEVSRNKVETSENKYFQPEEISQFLRNRWYAIEADALSQDRENAEKAALDADKADAQRVFVTTLTKNIPNMSDEDIDKYLEILIKKPQKNDIDSLYWQLKKYNPSLLLQLKKEKELRKNLTAQVFNQLNILQDSESSDAESLATPSSTVTTFPLPVAPASAARPKKKKQKKTKKGKRVVPHVRRVENAQAIELDDTIKKSDARKKRENMISNSYAAKVLSKRWIVEMEMDMNMIPRDKHYLVLGDLRESVVKELTGGELKNWIIILENMMVKRIINGWYRLRNGRKINNIDFGPTDKEYTKQFLLKTKNDLQSIINNILSKDANNVVFDNTTNQERFVKTIKNLIRADKIRFVKDIGDSSNTQLKALSLNLGTYMIELFNRAQKEEKEAEEPINKYQDLLIGLVKDDEIDMKTKIYHLRSIVKDMTDLELYSLKSHSVFTRSNWLKLRNEDKSLTAPIGIELDKENRNRVVKDLIKFGWTIDSINKYVLDIRDPTTADGDEDDDIYS